MMVLALDPSMVAFGWAVFADGRPTRAGVWETFSDKATNGVAADNAERFGYIAQQLFRLAGEIRPDRIFVEGQVYLPATSYAAISSAHRSRGLVDMLGVALGVEVIELSPQAVKKGLSIVRTKAAKSATGMASKGEVRAEILRLYPEMAEFVPDTKAAEGAADALAVGHLGLKMTAYSDRLKSASSW